uniref:Capsid protein n=1 Tax=Emberiza tristrami parvoviridae sp. TaxID=2794479 RepID=A0A8A4XEL5_9VIRU|nr:MAG: capsid protein [Emberiza tristrami parvoviridae sp.]
MPVIPFHKYIGPGNTLNEGDPVDFDDYLAQQHDQAYENANSESDIQEADRHTANDFLSHFVEGNYHSGLGALGLGLKSQVEKYTGVLYGMPNKNREHPYAKNLGVRGAPSTSQNSQVSLSGDEGEAQPSHTVEAQVHAPADGQNTRSDRIRVHSNIGVATPNKKQTLKDYWSNFDDIGEMNNMDTGDVTTQGSIREPRMVGGTKAGSGPGMGSAGMGALGAPSTIDCPRQAGTPFKTTLHQSYRFMVPACLTTQQIISISTTGAVGSAAAKSLWAHRYKIGSSLAINMDNIYQYMDASTYTKLIGQTTSVGVEGAKLEVWSLGVRAPYSTNTSNIEVANANLQAQIMDLSPIQHDYPLVYSDTQVDDTKSKMIGNTYQHTTTTSASSTFTNISARMETRAIRQRCIIDDYYYAFGPASDPLFNEFDVRPSDPNICQYIRKSVNGSNLLGKAFEHHYNISGILHSAHGTQRQTPQNAGNNLTASQSDNNATGILQYNLPLDANDKPSTNNDSNAGYDFQQGTVEYTLATLRGLLKHNHKFHNGDERHFIAAMYNIRNVVNDVEADTGTTAYNSIVDMNWEIILNFSLNVNGMWLTPLYYNVINSETGFRNRRLLIRDAGDNNNNEQCTYVTTNHDAYPNVPHIASHTLRAQGGAASLPNNTL